MIFDENIFPFNSTTVVTSETNGSKTPALISSPFSAPTLPTLVPSYSSADCFIPSPTLNPESRPNTSRAETSESRLHPGPAIAIQPAEGPHKWSRDLNMAFFRKEVFFS